MLNSDILNRFQCSGCGECCRWGGSVILTDADMGAIAKRLGLTEREFIDQRTRLAPDRRHLALLDQADGSCEFLEGDRCAIYEDRPGQCRTFPFAWSVPEGCPELDRLLADEKNVEQSPNNP